jgi:hypothetical protein
MGRASLSLLSWCWISARLLELDGDSIIFLYLLRQRSAAAAALLLLYPSPAGAPLSTCERAREQQLHLGKNKVCAIRVSRV